MRWSISSFQPTERAIDRSIAEGAKSKTRRNEDEDETLLPSLAYGTLRTPAPIRNRLFRLSSRSNQAAHQFYINTIHRKTRAAGPARTPRRHFLAAFAARARCGKAAPRESPFTPPFARARAKYSLPLPPCGPRGPRSGEGFFLLRQKARRASTFVSRFDSAETSSLRTVGPRRAPILAYSRGGYLRAVAYRRNARREISSFTFDTLSRNVVCAYFNTVYSHLIFSPPYPRPSHTHAHVRELFLSLFSSAQARFPALGVSYF